jgi:hypothetical protein
MNVQYGDMNLDFTKLPEQSALAMLKRGVAHYFGNEIASKISGRKAKFKEDKEGNPTGADMDEASVEALRTQFIAEALAKLTDGTVGTSTRGIGLDPVEAKMESIARKEIGDVLKANKAKFTGKGEDRKVKFADGSEFTMDQLVERRLANPEHADRIGKLAKKAIADAEKARNKLKVEGPLTADSL